MNISIKLPYSSDHQENDRARENNSGEGIKKHLRKKIARIEAVANHMIVPLLIEEVKRLNKLVKEK